jgi:hypothetical protein
MVDGVSFSAIKQLVANALVNDATVASYVHGRVFTEFPELFDAGDTSFPLIAMSFRAGRTLYSGAYRDVVFELFCVSRVSSGDATRLYEAAFTVLQAERLSIAGLTSKTVCQETQAPVDMYDRETRSWTSQSRWVARATGV